MAVKYETELYLPIKHFFNARGFEVKAEIRNCDLVAYRDDQPQPTIVEMKKTFTLSLLLQGIERQKTGGAVWLAIERNRAKKGAHNQRFNDITALCRRLNLGFLSVTFYRTKEPLIDVWCEPAIPIPLSSPLTINQAAEATQTYSLVQSGRRKTGAARLMREFNERSGDYNLGGSSKRKLITAYRERAIQIALALSYHGPSSPRQLREWTQCPTAGDLLRSNYYGWFSRVSKGVYELTASGKAALGEYSDVAEVWTSHFPWEKGEYNNESQ